MILIAIKNINKEISRLIAKVVRLQNEAENILQIITGMPHSNRISDKVLKAMN